MNDNKKSTLITIIVGLCIFIPLTVASIYFRNKGNVVEENPTHLFSYKGNLWFYDEYDKLLSTYECVNENCDYTSPIMDDEIYNIRHYENGDINKVGIINDRYTFITDGSITYLFAVFNGKTIEDYKAVKTYNAVIENNAYIVENNNSKWGVLSVGENLGSILPFEYDFIGLRGDLNDDNTLKANIFIVKKDDKWCLVSDSNSVLTGYIGSPITDYNDDYLFSKVDDYYRLYNWDGTEYLQDKNIKKYIFEDKYIGIVTPSEILIYEDLNKESIKVIETNTNNGTVELEKVDKTLNIKINGSVMDSIEEK